VLAVRALQVRFGEDETRFLESLSSLLATSLQRAHSEEALLHSQRLESVGQLTGGIAHDFNNLLTVISGNLQVLEDLRAVKEDAFGAQLVDAAARATRRGAELTGKLLAFSRRQVLQPAAVDAVALVQSLAGMLRRTIDSRVRLEVEAGTETPPCLADPGQLESALLNIAINARDAMPDGGTLTFRVAAAQPADAQGADLPEPVEHYVAVSIADTGTGMSEAVRERAFEPFFTTKESGRGTGLGLSTVYGFAKQSRGAARLDSTVGVGTTVTLLLPRARGDEAATDTHRGEAGALPPGLRVLVVEDDAEVRSVVMAFLASLGCEASACEDADSALAALDNADPDLLLTDIALGPGLRGTALAREVVRRRPGLPVLLMSGYASGLLQKPPEWPLLRKPYTREELAGALLKALAAAYDEE
jgi:signal transduction histidine kinase/CheY-like chemotaxis protein